MTIHITLDRCIHSPDCSHNRICIKGACIGKYMSIRINNKNKFKKPTNDSPFNILKELSLK